MPPGPTAHAAAAACGVLARARAPRPSEKLAVARLAPDAQVPDWAWRGTFTAVVRTTAELSVVAAQAGVPAGVKAERDWRALVVAGPLDFELTGVLAAIATPLAAAAVAIFVVPTNDTDFLLVRENRLELALDALRHAGHEVT